MNCGTAAFLSRHSRWELRFESTYLFFESVGARQTYLVYISYEMMSGPYIAEVGAMVISAINTEFQKGSI